MGQRRRQCSSSRNQRGGRINKSFIYKNAGRENSRPAFNFGKLI